MKNKKRNIIYLILAVVCIILIIIGGFVISDKKLDIEGDKVSDLYKYLGETDIYRCGGLNTYSESLVNKDNLSNENKLCMAYYTLDKKNILTKESDDINKFDTRICKVGENTVLAVSREDTEVCEYNEIRKNELNEAYKKIYGEDISDYHKFFIANDKACFLEGDAYYCGTSETFNYSIMPDATIYRGITKAIEKFNGDIIIYDYFLKVSDGKCYSSNTSNNDSADCTSALKENIDSEFISKYGTLYKHIFKKNGSSYYWFSSEKDN